MGTRITPSLIKAVSGAFELESVYKLSLCHMDIKMIENLEGCENLEELNLTGNTIERLEGLEKLEKLKKLTLTSNKLKNIHGIASLQGLTHLNIQDNCISDIECDLGDISACPNLKALYLKNLDGSLKNPVCEYMSYTTAITQILPKLQVLDGERLRHGDMLRQTPSPTPEPQEDVSTIRGPKGVATGAWTDEYDFNLGLDDGDKGTGAMEDAEGEFYLQVEESHKLVAKADALLSHYPI